MTHCRFIGYRPDPPAEYRDKGLAAPADQPQYEGVVFTDGTVLLRWCTAYRSTAAFASFEDFWRVHGHPEYGTRLEWPDGMLVEAAPLIASAEDARHASFDVTSTLTATETVPGVVQVRCVCGATGRVRYWVGQPRGMSKAARQWWLQHRAEPAVGYCGDPRCDNPECDPRG